MISYDLTKIQEIEIHLPNMPLINSAQLLSPQPTNPNS